jgi:hypothetical protein
VPQLIPACLFQTTQPFHLLFAPSYQARPLSLSRSLGDRTPNRQKRPGACVCDLGTINLSSLLHLSPLEPHHRPISRPSRTGPPTFALLHYHIIFQPPTSHEPPPGTTPQPLSISDQPSSLLSTSSKSHLVPEPSNSALSLVGDSQLRRTPYLSEHRIIWEDCTSRFTNYFLAIDSCPPIPQRAARFRPSRAQDHTWYYFLKDSVSLGPHHSVTSRCHLHVHTCDSYHPATVNKGKIKQNTRYKR